MIQVAVPLVEALSPCSCGRQPRHYNVRGKDLHFLECSPCGTRTAKHATYQEAMGSWESNSTHLFDTRQIA
jgi:hypothetical protein